MDRLMTELPFLCFFGCSFFMPGKPGQNILLFKDKDGVYEFDITKEAESLVWKVDDENSFLDEPYILGHDTLTFGLQGKLIRYDVMEKIRRETYSKRYISIDLGSRRHWVSKIVTYEVYRSDTMRMTTEIFNTLGKVKSTSENIMRYESEIISHKGVTYNKISRSFYWESKQGTRTIYSDMGNLFMVDGHDTTLLGEREGHFDPKFGCGFGEPQIHPSGEFVICNYSEGTSDIHTTYLAKIDLATKDITKIKDGHFIHPVFSTDGNFVLFKRDLRQGEIDYTWVYDIYWLDLKTNTEHKIGEANDACWKE